MILECALAAVSIVVLVAVVVIGYLGTQIEAKRPAPAPAKVEDSSRESEAAGAEETDALWDPERMERMLLNEMLKEGQQRR